MPLGQGILDALRGHREAQWLAEQMSAQAAQNPIENQGRHETNEEALRREIQAQNHLSVDPEVDRIASIFFTCLMTRINAEFNHTNPTWDNLGAREKQHWLAATSALLEELKKEPVAKNELAVIAKRRIIQQ